MYVENALLTFYIPVITLILCNVFQIISRHSFDKNIVSNRIKFNDINTYIRGHVSVLFHKNVFALVGNLTFYATCMICFERYFTSKELSFILLDLTMSYGLLLSIVTVACNKLCITKFNSDDVVGFVGFDGVCYALCVSISVLLYRKGIDTIETRLLVVIITIYEVVSAVIDYMRKDKKVCDKLSYTHRYLGIFLGLLYSNLIRFII